MKFSRPRIFYGWYVVAAGATILFCIQGARATFGVVLKPIIAEMAWSRGAISGAAFLNMTVFALSLTGVGKIYDRYGAKWVIVGSTLCVAIGYLSLAHINSYWQFLGLYGIVTALGFGGTSIPPFCGPGQPLVLPPSRVGYQHRVGRRLPGAVHCRTGGD